MKIAIGSDHAGYRLKEVLRQYLLERSHEVIDCGTDNAETSVDYPDFASAVASMVASGDAERGVLVCGTGIGVAIAANKVAGIRAANCNEVEMARLSREHNNANVLTIGGRVVSAEKAYEILDTWLTTEFAGGRHQGRLDKIVNI